MEDMMKKLLALTICFMLVGVVNSFAGATQEHAWELGTEISHIKYEEPGVMKEEGIMYGLIGSYTYRNNYMLRADGRFSFGQVDYKNSGTINNINDYMLEFRGLGGYDFSLIKASILTPYIGIGYRYLNDDMSGKVSSIGVAGYERESNYLYSPIGVKFITDLGNRWSVGTAAEYDIFWWGRQISHFSDVDPGYNDVKNHQSSGYGLRGSVELQKGNFVIKPFVRYWNIKESKHTDIIYNGEAVGYGYEPRNHSTEYGINLVIRF